MMEETCSFSFASFSFHLHRPHFVHASSSSFFFLSLSLIRARRVGFFFTDVTNRPGLFRFCVTMLVRSTSNCPSRQFSISHINFQIRTHTIDPSKDTITICYGNRNELVVLIENHTTVTIQCQSLILSMIATPSTFLNTILTSHELYQCTLLVFELTIIRIVDLTRRESIFDVTKPRKYSFLSF